MVFNDLVIILFLNILKCHLHLNFYLGGKVKRNHQLKIVKLEKTRQFSSLKSLEHQYSKQSDTVITQIRFLLSLYLSEQLLDFGRILGVIFSNL